MSPWFGTYPQSGLCLHFLLHSNDISPVERLSFDIHLLSSGSSEPDAPSNSFFSSRQRLWIDSLFINLFILFIFSFVLLPYTLVRLRFILCRTYPYFPC